MSSINSFPNNPQQQPPPRRRRRRRRRTRRHVIPTTVPTTTPTENINSSFRFSDSDAHSSLGGSSGIFSYNHSRMTSSDDEDEIDLESGELELKVHSKGERICRICHLNFSDSVSDGDSDGGGGGGGVIELGCDCKGDLGAAHKQCAETWFKIRGNLTCEICGATAHNVGGEQTNDTSNAIETEPAERSGTGFTPVLTETRTFWQGRRIMNILLGCMVFAFIISWLFHFNVLP